GRALSRPPRRARACHFRPGHQPGRDRGGRRLCRRAGGRAELRRGVLLPHRAALGQPRLLPKADRSLPVEEVLDSFVAQFYDDKPVPRLILLSHDVPNRALLAEALSTRAERKVEIRVPHRGTKSGLIAHALANAREALGRKLAE